MFSSKEKAKRAQQLAGMFASQGDKDQNARADPVPLPSTIPHKRQRTLEFMVTSPDAYLKMHNDDINNDAY